jgi:hypothetical protein
MNTGTDAERVDDGPQETLHGLVSSRRFPRSTFASRWPASDPLGILAADRSNFFGAPLSLLPFAHHLAVEGV